MKNCPQHVAIIMDGNGRWAKQRSKNRFMGHVKGAEVAQEIVENCARETDIKYLTLFAFSTENWGRPKEEVSFLFKLLDGHLAQKSSYITENNVRLRTIGNLEPLPFNLKDRIEKLKKETKNNTGLNLTLGLNYGGRADLLSAVDAFTKAKAQNPKLELSEKTFSSFLQTSEITEPDFIIRTSGEERVSNFMLWQSAYSELYFEKLLWPEYNFEKFKQALEVYQSRTRRFGELPCESKKLESQVSPFPGI